MNFNPRSPRGERRVALMIITPKEVKEDFNPRSPRGERQLAKKLLLDVITISIHALREESDDLHYNCIAKYTNHFNPRSPRGERPHTAFLVGLRATISIHALREESD